MRRTDGSCGVMRQGGGDVVMLRWGEEGGGRLSCISSRLSEGEGADGRAAEERRRGPRVEAFF